MSEIKDANFKVSAKYWFKAEKLDTQQISYINKIIDDYMIKQGFYTDDYRSIIFNKSLFEIEYYYQLGQKTPPISMRLKKICGLMSQEEIETELGFDSLRYTLDDHPYKVTFWITYEKIRENISGYVIKIEVEPVILFKKRRLNYKPKLNQIKYNNIIDYNIAFIKNIIACFGGSNILEETKAIEHLELKQNTYLFEDELLNKLPRDVRVCLEEANKCYFNECNIAASIMIRKSIETAIIIKFLQENKKDKIYTEEGYEITFDSKLRILGTVLPELRNYIKDIEIVKWFGDNGAHDPSSQIFTRDLEGNVAPKTRAFLLNLKLK